jgi:hypothetical protein
MKRMRELRCRKLFFCAFHSCEAYREIYLYEVVIDVALVHLMYYLSACMFEVIVFFLVNVKLEDV